MLQQGASNPVGNVYNQKPLRYFWVGLGVIVVILVILQVISQDDRAVPEDEGEQQSTVVSDEPENETPALVATDIQAQKSLPKELPELDVNQEETPTPTTDDLVVAQQDSIGDGPVLGSAQATLSGEYTKRMDGWQRGSDRSLWQDDEDSDSVLGIHGQIYRAEAADHWQFTTRLEIVGDAVQGVAVGARLNENEIIAITIRKLGGLLIGVQTIDADGVSNSYHSGPIELPPDDLVNHTFSISHVGNELHLELGDLLDHQMPLSDRSKPALWLRNGDPITSRVVISPGSTVSDSSP